MLHVQVSGQMLLLLAAAAAALLSPAAAARASSAVTLSKRGSLSIHGEPVRVDYYMEALCPYCANLTVTVLKELWETKILDFVELDLIAWGNAVTGPDGEAACQHGARECRLNKLINCAIAQHPMQNDWLPFIFCIEDLALKRPIEVEEAAHRCGTHAGMVPSKLLACYNGELGSALQRLAGQRTASLTPSHQWVPWLVVNGVPLLEDTDNLLTYICVAYSGRDRPKRCLQIPAPPSAPATEPPAGNQQPAVEPYKPCKAEPAQTTTHQQLPQSH